MNTFREFFRNFFESGDFMPRWVCGNWTQLHGWIYIISNIAIGIAYFTIPLLIYYFINKGKVLVFKRLLVCFILFILLCGTTHFIDSIIFWIPVYRLNAVILACTAVVSWMTVIVLYKYLPIALEFKSPEQLQAKLDEQTKELAKAYQKLAKSEKQFKALVNHNPDIITSIGKDLKYKFINDSLLNLRRINLDEIIGKSIEEVSRLLNEKVNITFIESVQKAFETGQTINYEFTTHTNTTEKSYFSQIITPIKNEENNEIEDVLTMTRDITNQVLNEVALNENIANLEMLAKKLESKRKILEDFTYIVSHNLRSPVANLSSILHLLEDENNNEMRDILMQKVVLAFEKLSDTVSDLTSVVQIRQNVEIKREVLRFENILKDTLIALEMQIEDVKAEIFFDFYECESIEYPKIYLESIFLNLLTNALKYSSPLRKPKIVFTTKLDKYDIISLFCEDNGLGIDLKRHADKLFGLHKTFHDHVDGKGIGLFITKNQIEAMGGSIAAESEVNKGTKFIIRFNNYLNTWKEK